MKQLAFSSPVKWCGVSKAGRCGKSHRFVELNEEWYYGTVSYFDRSGTMVGRRVRRDVENGCYDFGAVPTCQRVIDEWLCEEKCPRPPGGSLSKRRVSNA